MKTKTELRKEIAILSKQILPKDDYDIIQSVEICKKILGSEEYKNADTIFAYLAIPDEVDLSRVLADAFANGKNIFVPRITDSHGNMKFYKITTETKFTPGKYNIPEPTIDERPVDLNEYLNLSDEISIKKNLALVPGRAFTKNGKRLGRGGGYYDVFLSKYGKKVSKIGVCFPFQIVDEIPTDTTDCAVDKIISN